MRGSHKIIDWGHKAPASVYKIQLHRDRAFTQGGEKDGDGKPREEGMFWYDLTPEHEQ